MTQISTQTKDRLRDVGQEFNHFADHTGGFVEHLRRAAALIAEGSTGSLLEFGCGSGVMTASFAEHFSSVVVVDGSESYLARTRDGIRDLSKVELVHCLFDEFDAGERRFDNVVIAHVLEHVDDPEALLQFAIKLLGPGGTIHMVIPNAESLHRRMGKAMGVVGDLTELNDSQRGRGYKRLYRISDAEALLDKVGIRVVSKQGVYARLETLKFIKDHYSASQLESMYSLPEHLPPELWTECYFRTQCRG